MPHNVKENMIYGAILKLYILTFNILNAKCKATMLERYPSSVLGADLGRHRQTHRAPTHSGLTFAGFAVRLQGKAHGTAAAHSGGCVLACPVTPAIVHRTGFWVKHRKRDEGGGEATDYELLEF